MDIFHMKKKKNGDIKKLLSQDEKIYFITRLYELIGHGYMLEDSIEFLMIQYNASDEIIRQIKEDMYNGKKLSYILEKLGYSESVVSKMEFAEYYGKIESMLLEIERYLKIKKEQREKIIKTVRYPLFLTFTLIALIILFNVLIIPQFQSIYLSANINVDEGLKFLILGLKYLPHILTFVLLVILSIILYFVYTYKYKKDTFLRQISRAPLINKYFKYYISYLYALELSLFLSGGFSIKTCLGEMIKKEYNYFFVVLSRQIEEEMMKGKAFENIISEVTYFDKSMAKFISHGRKNSMLDKELKLFSDIMLESFLKLLDSRLRRLQPILFILLSFIIVALYLVILLPVFNMTAALR